MTLIARLAAAMFPPIWSEPPAKRQEQLASLTIYSTEKRQVRGAPKRAPAPQPRDGR